MSTEFCPRCGYPHATCECVAKSSLLTLNVKYGDIHPVMPRVIQGKLLAMCEQVGISHNDRERLYDHLKSLSHELAARREW